MMNDPSIRTHVSFNYRFDIFHRGVHRQQLNNFRGGFDRKITYLDPFIGILVVREALKVLLLIHPEVRTCFRYFRLDVFRQGLNRKL